MNLFILRHASAGVRRANPLLDLKRPLDKDGKQHCLQLAHVLSATKLQFDLIVSSPLKRSSPDSAAHRHGDRLRGPQILISKRRSRPLATVAQFQRLVRECAWRRKTFSSSATTPTCHHIPKPRCSLQHPRRHRRPRTPPRPPAQRLTRAAHPCSAAPPRCSGCSTPALVRALYATSTKSSRRKISRK